MRLTFREGQSVFAAHESEIRMMSRRGSRGRFHDTHAHDDRRKKTSHGACRRLEMMFCFAVDQVRMVSSKMREAVMRR